MKMRKHKGKVHPSPSSNKDNNNNTLSIINLLPAAILAIASLLSLEDREVLAYMVTRSMKPTTIKKNSKKIVINATHKPPCFDCECFDCYTCYWFKWDSSPNRELIHQAIEAFEDHLSHNEEQTNKKSSKHLKNKRLKSTGVFLPPDDFVHVSPVNADVPPENADLVEEMVAVEEVEATVTGHTTAVNGGGGHKGLARKVLPDVLGLFNSRLWNLWSPNV